MWLKLNKDAMSKKLFLPTFSLFTSFSTLLCCALPALLVTIGAGATLASIISVSPWLIALSKYKIYTFGFSALMLIFAGIVRYKSKDNFCPTDPNQAKACKNLKIISGVIYWSSVIIFLIGFFFAFIAVYIFY